MNRVKLKTSAILLVVALTGCGGGGGGGGSSSESDTLSFPSNAVIAEATIENGQKVEGAVSSNPNNVLTSLNSVDNESQLNTASVSSHIAVKMKHWFDQNELNTYSLNATVDEVENCLYGGYLRSQGTSGSDSASLKVTASRCNDGVDILDGTMNISASGYDSIAQTFRSLTVKTATAVTVTSVSGDYSSTLSKNSEIIMTVLSFDYTSYPSSLERYRLDLNTQVTDGSSSWGVENASYIFEFVDGSGLWDLSYSMYQTSGKVYFDNLGTYVEYDTSYDMSQTPFVFNYYTDALESGEARYNMASGGKVKIVVELNEAITYVDADGDGTYELSE